MELVPFCWTLLDNFKANYFYANVKINNEINIKQKGKRYIILILGSV